LKVRSIRDSLYENAYVVADGDFDSKTASIEERMVILGLIAEWGAPTAQDCCRFGRPE
jgi:hypothetical protein